MLVSFPAMQGIIGQKTYYSTLMKLGAIPKMFTFRDWVEFTPEDREQRILNKTRVPEIARYIRDNEDGYLFSSITASYKCRVKFRPVSEGAGIGTLEMEFEDANFVINDGQHRCAAIAAAVKENPALGDESISVLLFEYENRSRVQQMFSDLNRAVVKTSKSLDILYDHRDPMALVTLEVCERVPVFHDQVDKDAVSLPARSPKLFSLSSIYDANKELLRGCIETKSHHEMVDIAINFWTEVSKSIAAWVKVKDGDLKAMDLRQGSISSHSVVLRAIGGIGGEILQSDNWREKLTALEKVDWSKSNKDWEYICIVAGSVVSNRQARLATKAYLKNRMGLRLTDPEMRCLPRKDGATSDLPNDGESMQGDEAADELRVPGLRHYSIFGKKCVRTRLRDIVVHLLDELDAAKPGCLARIRGGRSRPYVAQSREELFPGSPHLAEDDNFSQKLSCGWYVDVNNNEGTMRKIIEQACEAAGIQFGTDVVLDF